MFYRDWVIRIRCILPNKVLKFINLDFAELILGGSHQWVKSCDKHRVKSVHIWIYSCPYFPAFGLNTDQNNSEFFYALKGGIKKSPPALKSVRIIQETIQNPVKHLGWRVCKNS